MRISRRLSPVRSLLDRAYIILVLSIVIEIHAQTPNTTLNPKIEVGLQLDFDASQTHVIGDYIPLFWRFTNSGTNACAFLWEGCCRSNGKLLADSNSGSLSNQPTGSLTAHRFARAERLDPGKDRVFETKLSDWVTLDRSGNFKLQGNYTGVLETQHPQTPKNIPLWRGTATSQISAIELLSTHDYLQRWKTYSNTNGLSLTITGPVSIHPVRPSTFSLSISNCSKANQTMLWPGNFSLWLLNSVGQRLELPGLQLTHANSTLTLVAGETKQVTLMFSPTSLETESLGAYRLFVDYRASTGSPIRVPSNALDIRWQWSEADLKELLISAATGSRTGARNPSLRLLRSHLSQIAPMLKTSQIDSNSDGRIHNLRQQLLIALTLKDQVSASGRFNAEICISKTNTLSWELVALNHSIPVAEPVAPPVTEVRSVLRHLGSELAVIVTPTSTSATATSLRVLEELHLLRTELAALPTLRLPGHPTNNVDYVPPSELNDPVLTLDPGEGTRIQAARLFPSKSNQPERTFHNFQSLAEWVSNLKTKDRRVIIRLPANLLWDEALSWMEPLLSGGVYLRVTSILP